MSWPIRFEGLILFHYSGLSILGFQTNLSVENELVKLFLILHHPFIGTTFLWI